MEKAKANNLLERSRLDLRYPINIIEIARLAIENDTQPREVIIYGHMVVSEEKEWEIDTDAQAHCIAFFARIEKDSWYRNTFDEIMEVVTALRTINDYKQ